MALLQPRRGFALLTAATVMAVGTLLSGGYASTAAAAATDPSLCVASDVQAGVSGAQGPFATYLKSLPCTRIVMPGDLTNDGTASQFATFNAWYGPVKAKILPARGNHDARSPLSNYTAYWGSRVTANGQPWYSVNLGSWHIVSLELTGSAPSPAELSWLTKDLDANRGKPTLAFWHIPRYSTGFYGDNAASEPLWKILAAHGADIVLNGHVHVAQRFVITRGIREWIDSSAGFNLHSESHTSALTRAWIVPGPQFGVLRLILHPHGYEWSFTNTSGRRLDGGTASV